MNQKKETSHPFVIIVAILLLIAIVANFIPSGLYDRVTDPNSGQTIVNPDTFRFIENQWVKLSQVMTSIPRGIIEAANVVVITLSIGGTFGVVKETGILVMGVEKLVDMFSQSKLTIIFILFFLFTIICGFIGTPELAIVYIPVLMPLFFRLGFDSMVAVGLSLTATAAGFSAAWTAPATVGIGHQLAELPLFSGMWLRVITAGLLALSAALYTAWYGNRILKDPSQSLVYEEDKVLRAEVAEESQRETKTSYPRPQLAGIVAIVMFFLLIVGVIVSRWGFEEMSGYFLLMGVVIGLTAGMNINQVCNALVAGFKEMLVGALIVGIARGISVLLNDAKVMDTIIMYLSSFIVGLPRQISAIGMFVVNSLFNAVVASGSGKAVISLPIMIPLADMADISRQTAILAYQLGDGITNILWPASGYYVAALAIGKTDIRKWVKWFLPLLIIWIVIAALVIAFATTIGY